jgi:hypothetical protein
MRTLLVSLLIALPGSAEWLALELTFQGTGCASCIESLPARIRRMRGVESAEVDAARGILRVKLASGNRVRLELVRDQIEQDGTKVTAAAVEGVGTIEPETERWVFRPDGQPLSYTIEGITFERGKHPIRLKADAASLRPEIVLRAVETKRRE